MRMFTSYLVVFLALLTQFGCSESNDVVGPNESVLFARVSWTEDVISVDLQEIGISQSDLQNNGKYVLAAGRGNVHWTSAGTQYSRSLSIGSDDSSADDDVECEQEGEHEGENEGCTFALSFSGSTLSIAQVNE